LASDERGSARRTACFCVHSFKLDVRENVPGLDFVMNLRPVTFHWDMQKVRAFQDGRSEEANQSAVDGHQAKRYTGFLEAAAESAGYDFSGVLKPENDQSMYQVSYSDFVVPLVKAVQEQQKEIAALKSQLASNAVAPAPGPFDSWTGRALLLLALAWGAAGLARVLRGVRPQWASRPALVPASFGARMGDM
jgi:hypothetical protein